MIEKIIKKIESAPMTFGQWLAAVTGVLFIRFLLEVISSSPVFAEAYSSDRLVHHYLGFVAIGVTFALCGLLFAPRRPVFLGKFIAWGIMITWLPPIYDLVSTFGVGSDIEYITAELKELPRYYMTYFGPFDSPGITMGMRIEIAIVLLALMFYTWHQTRSWIKALLVGWFSYTVTFIYFALPSFCRAAILGTFSFFAIPDYITNDFAFTLISLVLADIYFLILFLLAGIWFYSYSKKKFFAVIRNSRPERLLHYFIMALLGAVLAVQMTQPSLGYFLLNLSLFTTLLFVIYFAWMFSVGVNDLVDIPADKISNPKRPLVAKTLSEVDVRALNVFFLASALVGGSIIGRYTFFAVMIFISIYYIYSAPPLQLKRVPIVSSFLISLISFSAFVAGFFCFNPTERMEQIPMQWIMLIIITFTLASHIRDIKDLEGDRAAKIKTLPVIFGLQRGKQIIAALVAISFLIVPVILQNTSLWITSIPAALAGYLAVNRKNFKEWRIFGVYYIYTALSLWIYLKTT